VPQTFMLHLGFLAEVLGPKARTQQIKSDALREILRLKRLRMTESSGFH